MVQVLSLESHRELNVAHAKRFAAGKVRKLYILSYRHITSETVGSKETAFLVLPFLTHFEDLEYVFIGERIWDETDTSSYFQKYYPPYHGTVAETAAKEASVHRDLVESFGEAFRLGGLLPKNLYVDGLKTKCSYWRRDGQECSVCPSICATFSLAQVFQDYLRPRSTELNFVCIQPEELLAILNGREGGSEFLKQPERFALPLRKESCCGRPGGWSNYEKGRDYSIVYAGEHCFQLLRLLMDYGCEASQMRRDDLFQSLFCGKGNQLPPPSERYIMDSFFRQLVEYDFPLSEEDCVVIPHGIFR